MLRFYQEILERRKLGEFVLSPKSPLFVIDSLQKELKKNRIPYTTDYIIEETNRISELVSSSKWDLSKLVTVLSIIEEKVWDLTIRFWTFQCIVFCILCIIFSFFNYDFYVSSLLLLFASFCWIASHFCHKAILKLKIQKLIFTLTFFHKNGDIQEVIFWAFCETLKGDSERKDE